MRDRLYTVVFMAVVAGVFTGAVSAVNLVSRSRVELNRELAEKRVVLRVLGVEVPEGASPARAAALYDERVEETGRSVRIPAGEQPVLRGLGPDGETLGYAFRMVGAGLWGEIRFYVAVEPDLRTIRGLAVYRHNETPGLGGEIAKPWFEEQFAGKRIPEEPLDGDRLIRFAAAGTEAGPHEVDAITGATQTCLAVERDLNQALWAFREAMD
jgi:Na+-transporting NADH:ubiquinone oxidoreductase subunit C